MFRATIRRSQRANGLNLSAAATTPLGNGHPLTAARVTGATTTAVKILAATVTGVKMYGVKMYSVKLPPTTVNARSQNRDVT